MVVAPRLGAPRRSWTIFHVGPLVRELLARLLELGQFLELALHGRYSFGFVAHAPLQSFQPFLRAFFLFLPGLFSS